MYWGQVGQGQARWGQAGQGQALPVHVSSAVGGKSGCVGAREDETDCLGVLARFRGVVEGVRPGASPVSGVSDTFGLRRLTVSSVSSVSGVSGVSLVLDTFKLRRLTVAGVTDTLCRRGSLFQE